MYKLDHPRLGYIKVEDNVNLFMNSFLGQLFIYVINEVSQHLKDPIFFNLRLLDEAKKKRNYDYQFFVYFINNKTT